MNSLQKTENTLYEQFIRFGYAKDVAKAIAHSFTQFMLGYLTPEGVAKKILDSGAEADLARMLARSFIDIKQNAEIAHPPRSHETTLPSSATHRS